MKKKDSFTYDLRDCTFVFSMISIVMSLLDDARSVRSPIEFALEKLLFLAFLGRIAVMAPFGEMTSKPRWRSYKNCIEILTSI